MPLPFLKSLLLFICFAHNQSTSAWQVSPRANPSQRQRRHSLSHRHGSSSPENIDIDPVLGLPLMEAELATLLQSTDSDDDDDDSRRVRRHTLEGAIENAKTSAEFGVRRAQVEFYEAFSSGDVDMMGRVWSAESHVRCVHPGMAGIEGREEVMDSWRKILGGGGGSFPIAPKQTRIEISGLVAMCSCIEETPGGGQIEALNVYRREGGAWRMITHFASPIFALRSVEPGPPEL